MPFWPFKKREPEQLTAVQLRDKLVQAATSGSQRQLRSLCQQYKGQVADNADVLAKVPEEAQTVDASMNQHFQAVVAVAQCLANECGAPELWTKLTGNPQDNPLLAFEQWFRELPRRMQQLEYESLISEGETFLQQVRSLKGTAAVQHETLVLGRLGELLFQSGRVVEAIAPFTSALELCQKQSDVDGEVAYLNNLYEVHRYLGDVEAALECSKRVLDLTRHHGGDVGSIENRIKLLENGLPLCRVVCVRNGVPMELREITDVGEGSYKFQFERNRISLQKTDILVQQGNRLASAGELSDALGKYQEAMEVDPYDPDPVYQSGTCLLELGAFAKAREAYEEVERLAPGWFRCRSDIWLARSLEEGTVSDEEFRVLRAIEDGGMEAGQSQEILQQAIERFPDFAPFHLLCGDLHNQLGDQAEAEIWYRSGLRCVQEPDLETRLLCALAGVLPSGSDERTEVIQRVATLDGSLVAIATAQLMGLQ